MALVASLILPLVAGCRVEHYDFLEDDGWADTDGEAVDDAGDSEDIAAEGDLEDGGDEDEDELEDASVACIADEDAGDAAGGCPSGLACCDDEGEGLCVELMTDPRHCGECGVECDADEECIDGGCRPP
ncbi:MAG: hypothetical protein HY907_20870 [Deltaproteobacteria bacterium]|nr:hypothetical protein [Deltaproteobacteria bacterium]